MLNRGKVIYIYIYENFALLFVQDLKVIIMNIEARVSQLASNWFPDADVFKIPGRTYPVNIYYSGQPETDYLQTAVTTTEEQITRFCKDLVKQIETLRENAPPPLSIIPLYSSLPFELQEKIYVPAPPGKSSRRCIVSSDLAETCLATENIRFVIDSGFSKQRVYNSILGVESSLITPVSRLKAMIRAQRAGKYLSACVSVCIQ